MDTENVVYLHKVIPLSFFFLTNKRLYLHSLKILIAYVAEDGLVSHHWEKRPVGLANFICLSTGEFQGQEVEVGG